MSDDIRTTATAEPVGARPAHFQLAFRGRLHGQTGTSEVNFTFCSGISVFTLCTPLIRVR